MMRREAVSFHKNEWDRTCNKAHRPSKQTCRKGQKMEYPKRVMRISELKEMGFPEETLLCAYRQRGQTFAWKINATKRNSPIVFDTVGFEKWRQQQCKLRERNAV